jgi:hypothetical protein
MTLLGIPGDNTFSNYQEARRCEASLRDDEKVSFLTLNEKRAPSATETEPSLVVRII